MGVRTGKFEEKKTYDLMTYDIRTKKIFSFVTSFEPLFNNSSLKLK